MQIDSASLYLFVKELQKLLIPAQVRQIHQIDNRIMDIELFCPNAKPVHMIANTHTPPVVYLTSKSKVQNQYTPSQNLCMTLRKHLEGSRLSEVRQIDMDRILAFSFDRIEAAGEIVTKTLWAEHRCLSSRQEGRPPARPRGNVPSSDKQCAYEFHAVLQRGTEKYTRLR